MGQSNAAVQSDAAADTLPTGFTVTFTGETVFLTELIVNALCHQYRLACFACASHSAHRLGVSCCCCPL